MAGLESARAATDWGRAALEFAASLLEAAPVRGSATPLEARAAEFVHQRLSEMGVPDIRTQSFEGSRSIWLFMGLAFGFAILGHAAYWVLAIPFSPLLAVGVSSLCFGFSAFLLWRKFTFRNYPFQGSLPRGPSQNVLAVLPPESDTRERVVIFAHLDSQRVVWWYATDFLTRLYTRLAPVGIYGVILAPGTYVLAFLLDLRSLAWVGLGLAGLHFLAWFTGVTADLGVYSPGANDNASAVGSALALVARLQSQPLRNTETWIVFTGCEETGCDGARFFLEEYAGILSGALFLDFELVGIGDRLAYLASEGLVRPKRISPEVLELLETVRGEHRLVPVEGAGYGVFTEMGVVWNAGFKGVCLLSLREGSLNLPEWHRLTDRPEKLQLRALARTHDLAWRILEHVDVNSVPSTSPGSE